MGIVQLVGSTIAEHETRDPFSICQNLEIIVQRHPLVDLRGYCRYSNGRPVITLHNELTKQAERFVCAHELGHYMLHKRINRVFMDSYTYMEPGRYENEADKFAVQLLFGGPPLYQEPISQWDMADMLNVPACNVDTRLIELGIYH